MVDINMVSAILFVVIASCFLITLYKLMSHWFVELLVVIFCIGGVEVLYHFIFFLVLHLSELCFCASKKSNRPNGQIPMCFDNILSLLREH